MKTFQGLITVARSLTTRTLLGAGRWSVAAAAASALAFSASPNAGAQTIVTLVNPAKLPDLSVAVHAPAQVPAYDVSYLTVTVNNAAPEVSAFKLNSGNDVFARVDLIGLVPVHAEAPGMTCSVGSTDPNSIWNAVHCSGRMNWATSTTITVWFQPSLQFYCGRGTYTDASVSYTAGSDRNPNNNRSIARTDHYGCIN